MPQKSLLKSSYMVLFMFSSLFILSCLWVVTPFTTSTAFAATLASPKPSLTLNISQGPLGVTVTLKGKNFHSGQANLSYVDAQNSPGIFTSPSDGTVQVQADGSFISSHVILPNTGPAGDWKIVVTDSADTVAMASYHVFASPGSQSGGAPLLMVNPTSGKAGDIIAFSGSNWFPKGTKVQLSILVGVTTFPLLDSPVTSDQNGEITGAFHLPMDMDPQQVAGTITAADASGALHSVLLMTVVSPAPTPSASPTVISSPTPIAIPTKIAASIAPKLPPPNSSAASVPALSPDVLGILILVIGGTLGIAGIALLFFLLPWSNSEE